MIRIKSVLYFITLLTFSSFSYFSQAEDSKANKSSESFSALRFIEMHGKKNHEENSYVFGPLESTVSGLAAFVIGNIGYYTTESPLLKLSYSGIQTIGIINIGRGIYQYNSRPLDKQLSTILNKSKDQTIDQEQLAKELIFLFANEERAKRLALFYTSTFLATQFAVNSFLSTPPKRLKNVYLFIGGSNALIAMYSAFLKKDYEKAFFGDSLDLNPFFFFDNNNIDNKFMGVSMTYRF